MERRRQEDDEQQRGFEALSEGRFAWRESVSLASNTIQNESGCVREGRVDAVTVFQPGAEVKWQFSVVPHSPGLGELVLRDLPASLNPDTIRAALHEGEGFVLEVSPSLSLSPQLAVADSPIV